MNQYGHFCLRILQRLVANPVYTCFLLFIIYLSIMEFILYFHIRTRDLFDEGSLKTNKTITNGHIFSSLSVKEIMVGPAVCISTKEKEKYMYILFIFRHNFFVHH